MRSVKKPNLVFQVFIPILLLLVANAQTQTIKKTFNLQPDEQITVELDEYYSFAAKSFNVKNNNDALQMIQSNELVNEVKESEVNIFTLAFFQDNKHSKYFIGYKTNAHVNGDSVLIIYFYHIYLDQRTNSLKREILASKNLLSSFGKVSSASFYSSFEGFLSLDQSIYYFQYHADSGELSFKTTKGLNYLSSSFLTQETNDYRYILKIDNSDHQTYVRLLEIDQDQNSKEIQVLKISPNNYLNILSDPTQTVSFLYDKQTGILTAVSIDLSNKQIILNKAQLPLNERKFNLIKYQKIHDLYIFSFLNEDQYYSPGGWFAKMNIYQNINGGSLVLVDFVQSPFDFSITKENDPNLTFIDENTFIFQQNARVHICNYEKMQVSFLQPVQQSTILDSTQIIGNKILLLQATENKEGDKVYSLSTMNLSRPSIIIKGSDKSPIFISIQQDQAEFTLNLEISINPTQQLITTLEEQFISYQNYITDITDTQYFFPVEQYITGSNLKPTLKINIGRAFPRIQNAMFNQIIPLKTTFNYDTSQYQQIYQTDGYFSAVFTSKASNNQYYVTAAIAPTISPDLNFDLELVSSVQTFSSTIGKIDNFGSFILNSDLDDEKKTIFIPFVLDSQLFYQQILSQPCKNTNFAFASDTQNSILFIMCGQQITQYNYGTINQPSSTLSIIQKKILDLDSTNYSELICISNTLFISSSTSLMAYNYITNIFIGENIQIPILEAGKQQNVYLFSSTFIIAVKDNPITNIAQYSYNDFIKNESPLFLRNIIVQTEYTINNKVEFIPKRGTTEYLFVGTTTQDEYILYRINNCFSQNQFYTTTLIKSDRLNIPLISSDSICVLSSNSICSKILQQASVSYQMNIERSQFYSRLSFSSPFVLIFSNQSQKYDLQIVRNAQLQYGLINQQDSYLQDIRTQVQDNYFTNGTIFYFEDSQVYNACILGWDTLQPFYSIINRITINKIEVQDEVISIILYTLKVISSIDQIVFEDLLTISLSYIGMEDICKILDDQDSFVHNVSTSSVTINIYGVCRKWLIQMNITFTYDSKNNYTKATLNSKKMYSLDTNKVIKVIGSIVYSRLITIYDNQYLIDSLYQTSFVLKETSKKDISLGIDRVDFSAFVSYHVINRINYQKLQIFFFENGDINIINATNKEDLVYSRANIKELLKEVQFNVDKQDYINVINQIADNKFRIQFVYSFVYEVTFSLDNKNQLFISNARLFYYQEAFEKLAGGITGSKYTLLFGMFDYDHHLNIALYDANMSQPEHNIIRSVEYLPIESKFIISNTEEISENEFVVYFQDGYFINISVSDKIGIVMNSNKSDFNNESITIYPILLNNFKYWVRFFVSEQLPVNPSSSESFSFKILFSGLLLIINTLLILL